MMTLVPARRHIALRLFPQDNWTEQADTLRRSKNNCC